MAKAKYTKGADGYFTTKTWDGSYNQDGTKHRVTLRSKKSSADLEKQVIELKAKIRNGDAVRGSDTLFCEYAAEWLETYKAVRSTNTRKMYLNIITHHFPVLEGIRLQDIRKLHFQMLIRKIPIMSPQVKDPRSSFFIRPGKARAMKAAARVNRSARR